MEAMHKTKLDFEITVPCCDGYPSWLSKINSCSSYCAWPCSLMLAASVSPSACHCMHICQHSPQHVCLSISILTPFKISSNQIAIMSMSCNKQNNLVYKPCVFLPPHSPSLFIMLPFLYAKTASFSLPTTQIQYK